MGTVRAFAATMIHVKAKSLSFFLQLEGLPDSLRIAYIRKKLFH